MQRCSLQSCLLLVGEGVTQQNDEVGNATVGIVLLEQLVSSSLGEVLGGEMNYHGVRGIGVQAGGHRGDVQTATLFRFGESRIVAGGADAATHNVLPVSRGQSTRELDAGWVLLAHARVPRRALVFPD